MPISWTSRPIAGMAGLLLSDVGALGSLAIAVGEYGAIYTSADLAVWTSRTSQIAEADIYAIAASPTLAVAVGYVWDTESPRITTSPDGITWTERTAPVSVRLDRAAFLNGIFLAGGADRRIAYSASGTTWTAATVPVSAGSDVRAFAFGAGVYVAAVRSGVMSSPTGATWTLRSSNGAWIIYDVAFGAGAFVAVGNLGRVLRSTDGITWTQATIPGANDLEAVAYIGGAFYAVGVGGIVARSADGVDWDVQTVSTAISRNWYAIASTASTIVIAGSGGHVAYTDDGAAWETQDEAYGTTQIRALAAVGDDFVAAGNASGVIGVGDYVEAVAPPYAAIDWPLVVQALPSSSSSIAWPIAVSAPAQRSITWRIAVVSTTLIGGLNGAGAWAAAPDGRWEAVVVLDGADISARVVSAVTVRVETNAARTAEFGFVPAAPLQPMALIGRQVKIAFAQAGGLNAQPLFSGVVDIPEIDLQTGVIVCACTDQAQEVWAKTPRETIDAMVGGRWHVAISGEPEDGFQYLEERIQSVAASWALDALQSPRVLPWDSPARSVTVRTADVIDGSLSVALPSRDQLRTRINVRMQYRYARLRQRGAVAQYGQDLWFFLPTDSVFSRPSRQWLTSAMIEGAAANVAGWTLESLNVEHPPAGFWTIGAAVYTIPANVAPDLALGFTARYSTRWQQSITEDYTVAVVWDALEAQLGGPVPEEIGASLEAEFDQPDWANDASVTPAVPYAASGDAWLDWQPDGFDTASRDEAMRCLLDRAWVRLWSASRSGRVRFALPCRPDLWLDTAVTLEHEALRASGRVVEITHTLDTGAGSATSELAVAVGMPGATPAAHPTWVLPAAPADAYVPPLSAYSFEIGTFVGGEIASPPFDAETMVGFATNQEGTVYEGRQYYPHQLSIRAPSLAAEDRDPRTLESTATISVAVPTDTLEVM